ADGTFTYTPTANYSGADSFTYQVCDTDGDCDDATVSITVDPANVALSINKTDAPDPVAPGGQIVYTISYSNAGTDATTGVVITESYDSNVTFVSAVPAPTSGDNVWDIGNLAAGASGTITITVNVNSPLANGTQITNNVSLTSDDDTASDSETTTVSSAPSLSISKTDAPDPVTAGGQIVYTISYSNAGTDTATGVVITETYDSNVTFASAVPAPTSGDNTWTIGNLAAGASGTITVTVNVNSPLANGTLITNTVSLTANEGSTSDSETTTVSSAPSLSISKTDAPDPVTAGGQIVYTISYSNAGTDTATGVVITETYDSNVTFASAVPAPTSGDNTWTIGNLAAGASGTITVTVNVNSPLANGTLITNTVSLTANEGSTSDSETTTVSSAPSLSISKTDAPDPVTAGGQIVYTISYSNAGTDTATGVVITETYDSNVTFASAVPAPTSGDNVWTIGSLAAGASGTITVTVNVNTPLANGTLISNNVALTSNQGSTSDSETTTVSSAPSLSISKTDAPDPVTAGGQIVYTISYSNAGTDTATGVVITETYDSNVTFDSAVPAPTSGDNIWNIGSLATGASGTITVTVNVNSPLANGTLITNTVSLTANEGSSSDSETTTVSSAPTLSISKTDAPDPVVPGNQIVYTISYGNAGTDAATGVVITESYDANVTFVSAVPVPDIGFDNQWTIGNLAAGGSGTITVTVLVTSPLANGTLISNNVTLTSDDGTVSDSETTTIRNIPPGPGPGPVPEPALQVVKSDDPDPVVPGGQIVYTISYGNAGTGDATGVTITEEYDANMTFVSAVPEPDSGFDNQWTIGDLAAGEFGVIDVTLRVNTPLADGTILTNFVALDSDQQVTDDVETTTATSAPFLSIAKTDEPDPVVPDGQIVYTITYGNRGTETATNVTITEEYDEDVTFLRAVPAPDAGFSNRWTIGSLAAGASGTITVTVAVDTSLANGTLLVNRVALNSDDGTASASETTTVSEAPSLQIFKEILTDTVRSGDLVMYQIIYANDEDATETAADVIITEVYDNNTTYVSADPAPDPGFDNRWTVGNLAPGDSGEILVTLRVKPDLPPGTLIGNEVVIRDDANATVFASIEPEGGIYDPPRAFKTVFGDRPVIQWEMLWINDNPGDALNVHIEDVIPANTTYAPGSLGADYGDYRYDEAENKVIWEGSIPGNGGNVRIWYSTYVDDDADYVENQACAYWDEDGDGDWRDDRDSGQKETCTDDPATSPVNDPTAWNDTACKLQLGNFVWSTPCPLECPDGSTATTGINGVKINLYADSDHNGKFSPKADRLLASTETIGGYYRFDNLCEDDYIVQIDQINFKRGRPLYKHTVVPWYQDPNTDIDGDNNGIRLKKRGVVTKSIHLTDNGEPTTDGDADPQTNLSIDFGFYRKDSSGCNQVKPF
ncbi:MAG: cadherin-like domain-containing protein, partial [Thermodesulfobacteriota bacterium]